MWEDEPRCIKDHNRRLLAEKFELRRKLYKAFVRDPALPNDVHEKCFYKLSKLPRNSSFTRVRNRCIFSCRPRAVYEFFRMSRIVFRGLAAQGQLMGVKKASWKNPNGEGLWLGSWRTNLRNNFWNLLYTLYMPLHEIMDAYSLRCYQPC